MAEEAKSTNEFEIKVADDPRVRGIKHHAQALVNSIAARQKHLSSTTADERNEYQQTILEEQGRLAELRKALK